jgi:hypothetical protein
MMRLSPNDTYTASVKCLTNNESKEMVTTGARLDYYMKHTDFLVTITSTYSPKTYAPIDRQAGTKAAQAKAELTVTASN